MVTRSCRAMHAISVDIAAPGLDGGMKSEEQFTVNNDLLDAFEITPGHHLSLNSAVFACKTVIVRKDLNWI